jgi:uncharacterized protein (TIGR03437 family)
LFIAAALPASVRAHSGGADPGHTAGPTDAADGCAKATCHVGSGNPTRGSGVEVVLPTQTFTPGATVRLTVRVTGLETRGYGFQISARLTSDERLQAGDFEPVNGEVQVLCQDGSPKRAGQSCRADTPLQYATHIRPKTTNTFEFSWTAPASGDVKFYVAGNAANLNGQNSGDRIFLNNFTWRAGGGQVSNAPRIRTADPVLQAFNQLGRLSPQTWIQIYGENFAAAPREWAGGDFQGNRAPTSLGGVGVKINNRDAAIWFVSPTQINAQAPDDESRGMVDVTVTTANGSSTTRMNLAKVSPALLTTPDFVRNGRQYLAAVHPDGTFVGPTNLIPGVAFRPARVGDTIIVFAVGCGATTPATTAGTFNADARPMANPLQVRFGQTVAQASGFLAANIIGLYQLNVTVPNLGSGDVQFTVTVDGVGTDQNLFTTIQ